MYFNTPRSWKKPRWYSYLLAPIGIFWFLGLLLRKVLAKPYTSNVKIICVGNHLAGGTGKTPCVIALANLLKKKGKNVVCITKGYGGSIKQPTIVDSEIHKASDVGDEALLLAKHATTVIAKNRVAAIHQAEALSPDVIIMDDGFQNPTFTKTVSILLLNNSTPYHNHFLFPVGPCREPLEWAMKKAHLIVTIGNIIDITLPDHCFNASIDPFPGKKKANAYIAFAGIGYPDKFFKTAESCGYHLIATESFADHYPFEDKDMEALLAQASRLKAKLLTTQKDFMRIDAKYHDSIEVLPIQLQWKDESAITEALLKQLDS